MICLFLDTSSDDLIVYLTKDNKILFEKVIETIRDHSTYLVSVIEEAFLKTNENIKNLSKIIVGVGPGSFTGTRIGITVAKVLALSLNTDIIPISSLEKFIYSIDGYDYYVPIIEEKNNKLYFSIYDKNKNVVLEDSYSSKDELYKILEKYTGNITIISNNNDYELYDVNNKKIDIIKMINGIKDRKPVNFHTIKPNYIKKIEVESKL